MKRSEVRSTALVCVVVLLLAMLLPAVNNANNGDDHQELDQRETRVPALRHDCLRLPFTEKN